MEAARYHVLDDDGNDEMSSNSDATDVGCRNFKDRLGLERLLSFDAVSSGNRSEVAVKLDMNQAENRGYVEPSSSELTKFCQKKTESVFERLSGLVSRKRHRTDARVDVEQSGNIYAPSSGDIMHKQPPDSTRKKHRPDPLVLPPSSVDHYGYVSRLRSPRAWNGAGHVPYTPPPMLSPARRAPGLFWAAARVQNQPLWSLFRHPSAFTCKFFFIVHDI